MAITPPPKNWFQRPHGQERLWLGLAIAWCLVMSLMMPYWHFKGKQNSTGESYAVKPIDFVKRTDAFVSANTVGEYNGVPIVEPPPGGDAYLVARMWSWYPVLKLRVGETYRLHMSSTDIQHGFSLQPMNMNFQVMPGYDHVLTITPTKAGEYTIVCNEFCGIGHHAMIGKLFVE
jgi:cytochrome c oxidase subunit II